MISNILYISNFAAAFSGNFIASLCALAEKAEESYNVYFLFPNAAKDKAWIRYLPVSEDHIFWCDFSHEDLSKTCSVLVAMLGNKNTIVHTHFVEGRLIVAVRHKFSKLVCHIHITVAPTKTIKSIIKRMIKQYCYANAIMVGVSDPVTSDLRKLLPLNKCVSIPNAIDFSMLDRKALGSGILDGPQDSECFTILIHGTHFYRKGVDIAIEALMEIKQQNVFPVKMYVTSHNVEWAKETIRDLCSENLDIKVIYPVENIKDYYDSVDLFISPSRDEAFGYAVVEASYSECQVAASLVPGQDTMVGVPGILWFEKNSSEGLKKAIIDAWNRKQIGRKAELKIQQKAYVVDMFRIENWVEQNLNVYKKYFG